MGKHVTGNYVVGNRCMLLLICGSSIVASLELTQFGLISVPSNGSNETPVALTCNVQHGGPSVGGDANPNLFTSPNGCSRHTFNVHIDNTDNNKLSLKTYIDAENCSAVSTHPDYDNHNLVVYNSKAFGKRLEFLPLSAILKPGKKQYAELRLISKNRNLHLNCTDACDETFYLVATFQNKVFYITTHASIENGAFKVRRLKMKSNKNPQNQAKRSSKFQRQILEQLEDMKEDSLTKLRDMPTEFRFRQ